MEQKIPKLQYKDGTPIRKVKTNYINEFNMAQQTAVEWLVEQIKSDQNQKSLSSSEWMKVINQAKQMEKEQIIDAYYQCGRDNFEHIKVINRSATDYYNEIYGKQDRNASIKM